MMASGTGLTPDVVLDAVSLATGHVVAPRQALGMDVVPFDMPR